MFKSGVLLFSVGIHRTAVCVNHLHILARLVSSPSCFVTCSVSVTLAGHSRTCCSRAPGAFSSSSVWKRLEVVAVGSYAADPEHFHTEEALFLKNWCWISVELFVKKMLKEDIKATNGKDKDEQLESLNRLSETLKTLHEVSGIWGASATNKNLSNVDPVTCDTLARH